MTDVIFWSGVAVLGLLGSATWSGVETGFYCLSRVRLDIRLSDPHDGPARRVRAELADTGRLLTTILLGNNVCNYMGTLGVTALLEGAGLSDGLTVALQVVVLTPLLLVFGESLPKEVFRLNADVLPYRMVPVVTLSRWLATATLVLPVLSLVTKGLTRWLGGDQSPLESGGRRRLMHLLEESAHSGAISGVQGALAERALAFERATVREVMSPWSSVARIGAETSRDRATEIAVRGGQSWLPLTDRRGRVVGVVHALDVLAGDDDLRDAGLEPARLSPDEPVRRAVGRLAESGPGIAIVEVDGRPVGLVAEHDLVMPLIGTTRP
ncbi:MAG: CNNM domain-containing protein [Phycisphaerales bacterium]|nr:CNNM domain-containing protein [Phycisphaerales bacterium]